ncbi:MAG: anaerobic ribonucleoside-triphosphate reductase activating protein [Bacteroidales bacterium]|jgi:pyruvate formate lyase activating enzyme|nr:anaerobic ribonucleoside-triphosphate reductase activating protein [Bacteroidales bacterium]
MRIGALLKQSFVDWEGKTAAVIFTKGCNFRCGYCHNPSLVLPELLNRTTDISEKEIFDYLKTRKNRLDGVVITGGEPTIHNDLKGFISSIKSLSYKIKLDTNGTNPLLLAELLSEKLIDFIAMDIKTIIEAEKYYKVSNYSNPDLMSKINSLIKIIRNSGIEYQLRTTVLPNHHTKEIVNKLQQKFVKDNYVIQQFRQCDVLERTLNSIKSWK